MDKLIISEDGKKILKKEEDEIKQKELNKQNIKEIYKGAVWEKWFEFYHVGPHFGFSGYRFCKYLDNKTYTNCSLDAECRKCKELITKTQTKTKLEDDVIHCEYFKEQEQWITFHEERHEEYEKFSKYIGFLEYGDKK